MIVLNRASDIVIKLSIQSITRGISRDESENFSCSIHITQQRVFICPSILYCKVEIWLGVKNITLRADHTCKTMPNAQRTRGLSSGYQSKFFRSYHKFSKKSRSDFIFILPTKQQLQNLNPISAFRQNLNFKILTKPSFRISTKNNLHNLN